MQTVGPLTPFYFLLHAPSICFCICFCLQFSLITLLIIHDFQFLCVPLQQFTMNNQKSIRYMNIENKMTAAVVKAIKELYAEYLGEPGSHRAHELLHTTYVKRGKC